MSRPADKLLPSERSEIATELGVSERTVSRALESPHEVSEETRRRVLSKRESLGLGRTPDAIFGLVIPDDQNPFFGSLKKSIESRLAQTNFQLVATSSYGYVQREHIAIQSWLAMRFAGVFYAQNPPFAETLRTLTSSPDTQLILVDVDPATAGLADFDGTPSAVLADNRAGIKLAVSHLVVEKGHERLAFVKGPEDRSTAEARRRAFDEELKDLGLPLALLLDGDYTFESGRAAAIDLIHTRRRKGIDDSPTAVIASNDLMAIGVMKGLQRARYSVPDDFSVVGFDNIDACDWVTPELTSIDQRVDEIADHAVQLMTAQLGFERGQAPFSKEGSKPIQIRPDLKERKSVAGPPTVQTT